MDKLKSPRVIVLVLAVVIVAFLLLGGRCFYLQRVKNRDYVERCLEEQEGWVVRKAQRGVILDCRGRVLAASNKVQIVFADPFIIKEPKVVSSRLQPILDMGAHVICKSIMDRKDSRYARIKVGAEPDQCAAARRIEGIGIDHDWQRHYPAGRLASHVVGFASVDNRGLGGIELEYEKELAGSAGRSMFLADVHRRPVQRASLVYRESDPNSPARDYEPVDGVGIILTLDATIQQFVRAALMEQYKAYEAESAAAIVAEPSSGAILAMVSLPDFDPEKSGSAQTDHLRNRAITDQYEPGSVLKPIIAAIALDAGAVGRAEKIFCENGDYRGKGFGRIGEYGGHRYGTLSVREILVQSSNIGMAKIGQKLGKKRLYDGLALFGFGKKTGVDLPGEAEGRLRPVEDWTGYSVTRIPFGQEISVTAMQLLRAFCILANGGRLVRPHLVKAIVDNKGEIVKLNQPGRYAVGYIVQPEIARWIVTEAMVGVVNEGTGKRAQLEDWQVFGKTGTAQLARRDGRGYEEGAYMASFVAGAPPEDPAVVVLVSICRPNRRLGKGYTGGMVAAPVAAKIVEKSLNYLEYRGSRGMVERRVARRTQD